MAKNKQKNIQNKKIKHKIIKFTKKPMYIGV